MTERTIRVAVVGLGRLGSIHAKLYRELPGVELVAVCDTRPEAAQAAQALGVPYVADFRALPAVDAISVVTLTKTHREVAAHWLAQGVPCLVEKPLAMDAADGRAMLEACRAGGNPVLQVGHVERFNPALRAVEPFIGRPRFVECIRVSPFPFRSLDVGVVMDLMIHDIDIVLHLMDDAVADIRASGARVFAPSEDAANVRITFQGGGVAVFTASRIAIKQERKLRMYSEKGYASCDLLARQANVFRKRPALLDGSIDVTRITPAMLGESPLEYVLANLVEMIPVEVPENVNPLRDELADFIRCVREKSTPLVTGEHGLRAVETAQAILRSMEIAG
ncbi:MAG: Gfo/Idh/MocA family protein [Planctomycetota bacterium]